MASFFLRTSATNLFLCKKLPTMTSPRTLYDLLRPQKRSKPSSSSPNLRSKPVSSSAFDSTVSTDGGSPSSAGLPASCPDSPSGCFSAAGDGEEIAGASPSISSLSSSVLDADDERLPSDKDSTKRNSISNGSIGSEVGINGENVGSVSEIGISSMVSDDQNGGSDLGEALIGSSISVSEYQKERSPLQESLIENPGFDSSPDNGDCSGFAADISMPISGDQRKRMEINRSFARAKRNLRICTERVSKARAEGLGSFKLEELLVEETWLKSLSGEFQKPYMKNLCSFVECEMGGSVAIYPPPFLIFNSLNSTPLDRVKAVIIGQDPYHGPGQAMGLSFSVPEGVKIPSSLINIFKELRDDTGCSIPLHGNLGRWAIQGVLLLNTVLTVRQHQANSHAKRGWEVLTDAVIQTISHKRNGIVFLLWGNCAQEKSRLINVSKHHILKAAHPSGLSAHRGFFGCRHFSQTNRILEQSGLLPIDWQL